MHVGDLDGEGVKLPRGYWQAIVTITVHDRSHNSVASATVSGSWSGAYSGTGSCNTDISGQCQAFTEPIPRWQNIVTFSVEDVTHLTLWYERIDNHDPDGDSDGTMITARKFASASSLPMENARASLDVYNANPKTSRRLHADRVSNLPSFCRRRWCSPGIEVQ